MTAVLPARHPGAAIELSPAGESVSTARRVAGTVRHYGGVLAPWLVRGLLGLAVAVFAVIAVGPHVMGYRTMTMLTGSMAPKINPGDVTIVTPIATSDVTQGMVITYHRPIEDHSLVTHRVVSVQKAPDGGVTVQTKGDANAAVDPWAATLAGETAYQVRAVIPYLGHVIEALRAPMLTQALVYGAPAVLVGWMLLSIWRPTPEAERVEETEQADAAATTRTARKAEKS
jgi:signal peptidase I